MKTKSYKSKNIFLGLLLGVVLCFAAALFLLTGTSFNKTNALAKADGDSKAYKLSVQIVNTEFKSITSAEVDLELNSSIDSKVMTYVTSGDEIVRLKLKNSNMNFDNYHFVSWQLKSPQGEVHEVGDSLNPYEVRNLSLSGELLETYADGDQFVIYAVYNRDVKLNVFVDAGNLLSNCYRIYEKQGDNFVLVDSSKNSFEYGATVKIEALWNSKADFSEFKWLRQEGDSSAHNILVMQLKSDRQVTLSYLAKTTSVKISDASHVDGGSAALSSDAVKVGDTLVLSLKHRSGQNIQNFKINDLSADEFVKHLNSVYGDGMQIAKYDSNGVLSVYINENVFQFFAESPELKIIASYKMNSGYLVMMIVYIVLALLLGAGIITLYILTVRSGKKVADIKQGKQRPVSVKENSKAKDDSSDAGKEAKENLAAKVKPKTADEKTSSNRSKNEKKTKGGEN